MPHARFSGPEAVAARETKFAFWASMGDLLALVMRSGAPQLRLRIGAAAPYAAPRDVSRGGAFYVTLGGYF